MGDLPRLDVLLYAHDGRGLGHASRTIAIGMALRRLFPELRVLFISGCNISQELIGAAPLDWLKLPSYETRVINGKSQGLSGRSNYTDRELGELRTEQLRQVMQLYRPKVVLVDHSPQGKHKELVAALEESRLIGTIWVLGIRAVMGEVSQLQSDLAASLFKDHYATVFWYGDSAVLGSSQLEKIHNRFATQPIECGYVSRILEFNNLKSTPQQHKTGGLVSVPWFGEKTADFLNCLARVLANIRDKYGKWHIYLDDSDSRSEEFFTLFGQLPYCTIERPNHSYMDILADSKCAIIYGGYNSLMDVLSLSVPSLVIMRDMQDDEQELHLNKLLPSSNQQLITLNEQCNEESLYTSLIKLYENKYEVAVAADSPNLNGGECVATHIAALLGKDHIS